MVRLRTEVEVRGFRFAGVEAARPAPGVIEALAEARAVIIAPSNPFVSIGPILAVPGVREALAASPARRAAVSPIIAGQVVKGPAAKMLASLGHEVSALGVARLYRGLIDLFVLDTADAALAPAVEALGMRVLVTETLMSTPERKQALAVAILEALEVAP
jgi:LPPG:FO 2-phospho-L-lactate transferase